jgi:hypothetical protein
MRRYENAFHSSARLRRSTSTRTWRKILAISRRRIDESSTLQALKTIRAELFDPTIATHNGRLVKTTVTVFWLSLAVWSTHCATKTPLPRPPDDRRTRPAESDDGDAA